MAQTDLLGIGSAKCNAANWEGRRWPICKVRNAFIITEWFGLYFRVMTGGLAMFFCAIHPFGCAFPSHLLSRELVVFCMAFLAFAEVTAGSAFGWQMGWLGNGKLL